MCGSQLRQLSHENAEAASAEIPEPARAVSGPSFLGLGEEPTASGAYLLEDDASRPSRAGLVVAILFVAAVAASTWHWRGDLKQWAGRFIHNTQTQTNASYQVAPISTSGSEVAGSLPTAQSITATPAVATPENSSGPPAASPAVQADNSASANAATSSAQPPASSAGPLPPQADTTTAVPNPMSDQPAAKQSESAEKETLQPARAADTTGDNLEAEGEKYLYGSGVPADCSRAQKNLLTAADQESSKAASVLGTMYVTGHCVPRDLSLAYVWFAKAMRLDPDNPRFEHDLMVVWNQMTPDERQIAIHRKP